MTLLAATPDDPLLVWSPTKQRFYRRKFDHDIARSRVAAGESVSEVATSLGVVPEAVYRILTDASYETRAAKQRASTAGTCVVCGGYANRRNRAPGARIICRSCVAHEQRTGVMFVDGVLVALRCSACTEWWDPSLFTRGRRYKDLRPGGFSPHCRTCSSAARTAYRERHKVSCEGGCGTMVEGKGRTRDNDRPHLCHDCERARR